MTAIEHPPVAVGDLVDVIVGYLVTLRDGFECRMGPDRTRAENYAIQQRALSVEEMFVRRNNEHRQGA